MPTNFFDFKVTDSSGKTNDLKNLAGKVTLIVNVASQCGLTPQYAGLESLYKKLSDQGFTILGFPCNQFGEQEPGTSEEITSFCSINYGVSFPIMAKIEVNGDNAHPLYKWLKEQAPGLLGTEAIKWNFTKFLIDKDGRVLSRYAPQTEPLDFIDDIEKALNS